MKRHHFPVLAALGAAFLWPAPASAHEWFSGYTDPVFKWKCCDGQDCGVIPLPRKSVTMTRDGYHVRLSIDEARSLNPSTRLPVDGLVPWARVIESPTGEYGACPMIYRRDEETAGLWCLFVPPNS